MANIKQRLRRYNGTNYDNVYLSANVGDVVGTLSTANGGTGNSSVDTTPTSGSTKMVTSGGVYTELQTLKTSVSNGKSAIASAITDKGVSTSSSDTFDTMATNIRKISFNFSGANVTVDDLPVGVYAWDANGQLIGRPWSNPLNTDQLTLGDKTVYFTAYPNIKWQVQHIDGNYVYLALAAMKDLTTFGTNNTYSGSIITSKCTSFLIDTIPNVADYLEDVTVNGVTAKVFIPSYDQLNSEWDWPKAGSSNRKCQRNGSDTAYWTSTAYLSSCLWIVMYDGGFISNSYPSDTRAFRPAVKVLYKFTNPLNTDQLTLGQRDVYFMEYPDIKWCVDHIDGNYVYLGLYSDAGYTRFGTNSTYSGSTIASKCTTFLNDTIPNVADYLEDVTVEGVTNKVFIPTYYQFSGQTGYGDTSGPVFSYTSASAANREACYSKLSNYSMWLSTASYSGYVWGVRIGGGFYSNIGPADMIGFRPEVKVRYKA